MKMSKRYAESSLFSKNLHSPLFPYQKAGEDASFLSQKGKEGIVYDLSGRRVSLRNRIPKGVYIQNGKKVVVK